MSLLLTCDIKIDKYRFFYAESIEVESSWQDLGDKCTIKLPNKIVLVQSKDDSPEKTITATSIEKTFKTGMKVSVKTGYDNNNELLFEGYIAHIKPNTPIEIICEDEIYKFKRSAKVNTAYTGTLKGLLNKYFAGVKIDEKLPDVKLSNFMLKNATQAEILKELKDAYGFCAYFYASDLYVGLPYFTRKEKRHKFHFQKNIISSDLEYKKEEDIRLKAKVVSFLSNNTKIEVEVGDTDGELKTFHFPSVGESDKAKLKTFGEMELKKLKFEGYRGTITTFGIPKVQHSEIVRLYDNRLEERSGQAYLVDKVKTSWGTGGYRQDIEIARKVSV